jgi:hypothetical protein
MTIFIGLVLLAPLVYGCYKALLNAPPTLFDWPSITPPPMGGRERRQ